MTGTSRTYAARTDRQTRAAQLAERGWTREQIAVELQISLVTLDRYNATSSTQHQGPPDHWNRRPFDPDLEWTGEALCIQVDDEMFFPDKGGSTKEAKAVCSRCPVTDACLAYALRHDERFGVWGGKSERERRRLRGATP